MNIDNNPYLNYNIKLISPIYWVHNNDNGFGIFRRLLKTKLEEQGKKYIVVNKYYPSSKICNECGYKKDNLTLDERVWECPNCHKVHNRDINASINLKQEGLRIYKEIK